MKTFREIAEMHYASESSNEFDKKYREQRITALEKLLTEQLRIHDVVGRSEQLVCEYCNEDAKPTCCDSCLESMVNAVQKENLKTENMKVLKWLFGSRKPALNKPVVSGSLLSFEQCLREEFLVNTQNYPKEYHQLFKQKFERAEKRFKEQSGNDR